MTKSNYLKITGIFSIFLGIFNIVLWIMLILTNQIPNWPGEQISYIFHWISEFGMALLMILSGFYILFKREQPNLWFFADGMLFIAIFGAGLYYTFIELNLAFIIMATILTIASLYFFIIHRKNKKHLILLIE